MSRRPWPDNVRELRSKVAATVARKKTEGVASVDLAHLDLPTAIVTAAQDLSDENCRRELWQLADEIARDEGFTHGTGLQRRAAEIMGVGEPQASKMYRAFGLADAATA
jgi:transcriptional regulator with AAA-type ATPase domain